MYFGYVSARSLQHDKHGMEHQYMKLYYLNFFYLRPREEAKLGFCTGVCRCSMLWLSFCPLTVSKGVFFENDYRYMSIHQEDMAEEILHRLR